MLAIGDSEIYCEGDDEYDQNLVKTLEALPCGGLKDGTTLDVSDLDQDLEVNINIVQMEFEEEDERGQFTIGGDKPVANASSGDAGGEKNEEEGGKAADADANENDEIEIVDPNALPPPPSAAKGKKRGRGERTADGGEGVGKKAKGGGRTRLLCWISEV